MAVLPDLLRLARESLRRGNSGSQQTSALVERLRGLVRRLEAEAPEGGGGLIGAMSAACLRAKGRHGWSRRPGRGRPDRFGALAETPERPAQLIARCAPLLPEHLKGDRLANTRPLLPSHNHKPPPPPKTVPTLSSRSQYPEHDRPRRTAGRPRRGLPHRQPDKWQPP